MSSSDFRQITIKGEAERADRLFRAAVSAFCSLTRPSRREIAQLEDLALPLFDQVSVESKRYVAAALSECAAPPPALVRRLADESVDIAAPLLIRSPSLTDADLVELIGRHGFSHARAIGRRAGLNPSIASLVAVLERKVVPLRPRPTGHASGPETSPAADRAPPPSRQDSPVSEASSGTPLDTPGVTHLESTIHRLRSMMLPAPPSGAGDQTVYDRLRETVLSGRPSFFQTALADALGKNYSIVRDTSEDLSYAWLLDALRVLDISDEKAFLVTSAFYPSLFGELNAIRLFLLRYAAISRHEAKRRIDGWRQGSGGLADGSVRFAG